MKAGLKGLALATWLFATVAGAANALELGADALVAVDRNRGAVIERIVTQFKGGFAVGQEQVVRETLKSLRADHLLAASLAPSLDGLLAAMKAADTGVGGEPIAPKTIGDPAADLVYTPVWPCRLFDTRLSQGGAGALVPGVTRSFSVTAPLAQQGGPGGCTAPSGTAVAMIHISVVEPTAFGLLGGGATGTGPFQNALILYQPGDQYAATVPMPVTVGSGFVAPGQFDLVAVYNGVNVAGDLLGYFKPPSNPPGEQLWAVVDTDGSLSRGNRVTSTSRNGVGSYEVVFNRNVANCVFTATVGSPVNLVTSGLISVARSTGNVNGVFVSTKSESAAVADTPFHLLVMC